MKQATKTIAWTFYCISVLILCFGFIGSDFKYGSIALASTILLVPWVICILNSAKSKNNANGLWVWIIVFFGLIAIPFWLIFHGNDNSTELLGDKK